MFLTAKKCGRKKSTAPKEKTVSGHVSLHYKEMKKQQRKFFSTGVVLEPLLTPMNALNMLFVELSVNFATVEEVQQVVEEVKEDFLMPLGDMSSQPVVVSQSPTMFSLGATQESLLSQTQEPTLRRLEERPREVQAKIDCLAMEVVRILCERRNLAFHIDQERRGGKVLRISPDQLQLHKRACMLFDRQSPQFALILACEERPALPRSKSKLFYKRKKCQIIAVTDHAQTPCYRRYRQTKINFGSAPRVVFIERTDGVPAEAEESRKRPRSEVVDSEMVDLLDVRNCLQLNLSIPTVPDPVDPQGVVYPMYTNLEGKRCLGFGEEPIFNEHNRLNVPDPFLDLPRTWKRGTKYTSHSWLERYRRRNAPKG
ncbi:hypothetical protein AGDE_12765 [Angomonas deanei]|uniref:Uncharacterized protein n=1 Tax=Angomonas deanei TaxID=59799 RepID=A0A7G2CAB1_9TRYP|nr:hypothetical protein AGDE_12765 [Angomonas deanei]CAD2216716.1 hypothetical protein, conserved [Angomonas deanei]|eukprot:EPY23550.1 hypothetical protein AGDE_12765 [Angomonas deanei]